MTRPTLTKLTLAEGVWTGRLTDVSGQAPTLDLLHEAERLAPPRVTAQEDGSFLVEVDIPVARLADGVQTFVIATSEGQETLATIPFVCGTPLADDIRAEIDLLRDELDMLKRAFRRHCVDTGAIASRPADEA